jgi:hypothetical protein
MGWDFTHGASRQDIVNQILGMYKKEFGVKILDHACTAYGKRLWLCVESDKLKSPLVVLYLLDKSKGYGWGYKCMDETMGPYYHDCPQRLIKGEAHNQFSANWRQRVAEDRLQRKHKG